MNPKAGPRSSSKPKSDSLSTKKRTFLFTLTTILLATLSMLLIMEVSLQVVIRFRDGKWLFLRPVSSRVNYTKLVKDKRKFTLKPGFAKPGGRLVIDSLGFRKGPFPIDPEKKIIVNAGDSIAFGVGVSNEQTYPYYLAQMVKEKGIPVNVLNSGIPSYNMWQSFDRLRLEVFPHFEISRIAVITIQVANDVFLLSYYRDRWFPEITWAERRFIKKKSLRDQIATIYYGEQVIQKLFGKKKSRNISGNRSEKIREMQTLKYYNYEGKRKKYDQYGGIEMIEMVRQTLYRELRYYQDFPVYIILMPIDPFYYQLSSVEKNLSLKKWKRLQFIVKAAKELIFQYNELLIEVSQKFDKVFFFDTRPILDAQNRDETHVDHIHYSGKGNKIIASTLLDFMIQHHLIPEQDKE